MNNLMLTTLVDPGVSRLWRSCGKAWIASLLRHLWDGSLLVVGNMSEPVFPVGRPGLVEKALGPLPESGAQWERRLKKFARDQRLRHLLEIGDAASYNWVLLADADCVALRNLDHLFSPKADLMISRTGQVIDPGFVAVRGSQSERFARALESAGGLNSAGLAVLVDSGKWHVRSFERGEVTRPDDPGMSMRDLLNSAVIHFSGLSAEEKQRLTFAFHMQSVYSDKGGVFLDILEA
jgi:hypothetical protein